MWAGNPVKQIETDVLWDRCAIYDYTNEMNKATVLFDDYLKTTNNWNKKDRCKFEYSENETISYDVMDYDLNNIDCSMGKLEYILNLEHSKTTNRFVHLC